MRKLLLASLALAFIASAAFAEDADPVVSSEFHANIYTGAFYSMGSKTINAEDRENYGEGASGLEFNGAFSYGDMGAKFETRALDPAADISLKLRSAYAYYDFLGGKLRFEAGLVKDRDFSTGYGGYKAFDESGAALVAKPLPGLSIGYLLPYSPTSGDLLKQFLASSAAIKISIPNVLDCQVFVRQFDDVALMGDLKINAVNNLDAIFEWAYNDPADWGTETSKTFHLSEQASYYLGDFAPTLDCTQWIPKSGGVGFTVKPSIAYFLTKQVSLGAEYEFWNANQAKYKAHGTTAFFDTHIIEAYGKYDFVKGYLKLQPGYDTAKGYGFFVRAVFDAFL